MRLDMAQRCDAGGETDIVYKTRRTPDSALTEVDRHTHTHTHTCIGYQLTTV